MGGAFSMMLLMRKIMITKLVMVLALILPLGYAANINLGVNAYTFEMCPYSTQAFDGYVENTYSEPIEVKVYSTSDWITAAPDSFVLTPGEKKDIKFFLTPDVSAKPGTYRLKISAYSKEVGEDEEEIKVNILDCHDVGIEVPQDYERIHACIGDVLKIPFDLNNNGKATELVKVSVDANNGNLEFEETELDPQEIERDYLYYKVTQEYDVITLKADSLYSFAHGEAKIYVSGRVCYDYDMTVVPQSTDLCKGDKTTFKIYVKNNPYEKNTVKLKTSYGKLSQETLELDPDENATITLEVVANKEGNIAIDVIAESKSKVDVKNVQINSLSCRDGTVVLVPERMETCKGSAARFIVALKNKGDKEVEGKLSTTLGDVEIGTITIPPKKTIYKEVYISTMDLDYGNYTFEVTFKGDEIKDVAKANLTVRNCYNGDIKSNYKLVKVCSLTPSGKVDFVITNTGEKPETYYLKGEYGFFEIPTITLKEGESKKVGYIVNVSKDVGEGIIEDKITLEGMHMPYTKTTTLEIEVLPQKECSNYTVSIDPQQINAYELKGYIYYVTIKNDGLADNKFRIELENKPEFVYVEPAELEIKSGKEGKFFIYVAPNTDLPNKVYKFKGKVIDKYGVERKFELTFNLMVEKAQVSGKEPQKLRVVVENFDREKIYTINKTKQENLHIKYYMEGKIEEEDITFLVGSFIVQVGDELYEDQNPEIGKKTYTLRWNNKTYHIDIEFLKVDNEKGVYKFRVERIEIIKDVTPIYTTPQPENWLFKYWPWLIPLAVLIIGLLLVVLEWKKPVYVEGNDKKKEITALKQAIEQ